MLLRNWLCMIQIVFENETLVNVSTGVEYNYILDLYK